MRDHIERHYTHGDVVKAIVDGLRGAGKDLANLTPSDLAAVDEFHVRGREASVELAQQLGLNGTMRVLDVGCGLGGSSRLLAADFGCKIIGIDLTEAYIRAASTIAGWVDLDHQVEYRQGDALHLPFEEKSFDVVWTQHVDLTGDSRAKWNEREST